MSAARPTLRPGVLLAGWLAAGQAVGLTGPINVTNKVEPTRSQSIGGAATAIGADPTLVWVNPAAPAQVSGSSLTLAAQRGYFDDVTGQGLYTVPLRSGMLSVGALYYDEGITEAFRPDDTLVRARVQQDVLAAAGFAMSLSPRVASGALLKVFHSRIAQEAAATAGAGDLGIQVRLTPAIKFGAAFQNIGTGMRFLDEPVALPTIARIGLAAGWRFASPGAGTSAADTLILSGDAEYQLADAASVWHGGAEYHWRNLISLRAGARISSRREPSSFAVGLGARVTGLRVDYCLRLSRDFESPQTFSVTFSLPTFGAVSVPSTPADARLPVERALPDTEPGLSTPVAGSATLFTPSIRPTTRKKTRQADGAANAIGSEGLIDDLNRHLDDLLESNPKKPKP